MAEPSKSANADGTHDTPVPFPPHIENIRPTVEAVVGTGSILRESRFINMVTVMMSLVTAMFVVALVLWSDQVTSPQWRYLFTFPGGKWTWSGLFGFATLAMLTGLVTRWHWLTAIGNAVLGISCALVAVFYAVAPVVGQGVVTFGWYPWLMALIPSSLGAVIYWKPTQWF